MTESASWICETGPGLAREESHALLVTTQVIALDITTDFADVSTGDDVLLGQSDIDQLDEGDDSDVCNGGSANDTAIDCETVDAVP